MKEAIRGPDEEAKALGFNPLYSAIKCHYETLFHGEYRYWLNTLRDGLAREQGIGFKQPGVA